jgi:hypothetical protein
MDQRAILASLIRFDQPLAELEAALDSFDGDGDPVVTLTRKDIAAIIHRYLGGLLHAAEVERWANLIECREDIAFEPRHEPVVADAIFDLANPDLQRSLADISTDILSLVKP